MGGFLSPEQADRLRTFFETDELAALQEISDADPYASGLAEQISSMPDLTRDQLKQQYLLWEQCCIANDGYRSWFKEQLQAYEAMNVDPEELRKFREQAAVLKVWAEKQGWLEHGRSGPSVGTTRAGG